MSPDAKYPWSVLGLDKMPPDVKDIRRAYARALKQIDQAKDIDGFSALRAAYENALAIREGRSQRNDYARARAAEAKAERAIADAALPEPAPDPEPPAPPPPSPEDLAEQARAETAQALLDELSTESIVLSAGERINKALDSPLIEDPDHAASLRHAIANLIRSRFRQTEWESTLSAQIDGKTLLRLDKTYGWLSDFGAFRRDFWQNHSLLDAMATRAYGSIKPPPPPVMRPKTRAGRAWLWAKTHATALTVGYIGVIVGGSALMQNVPGSSAIFDVLLWMIVLPIALALLGVGFIVFNGAFIFARGIWRSIHDAARRFMPKR